MIGQEERDCLDKVTEVTGISVDRFKFKMEQVEGLRFVPISNNEFNRKIRGRASDALDKCSKRAIRDGRVAEIKQAILNSKKLQVRLTLI